MFSFLTGARVSDPSMVRPRSSGFATLTSLFGQTDRRPSMQETSNSLRGLFYACLTLRAHAVANAILGTQEGDGFSVLREVGAGEYEAVEPDHPWWELLRQPSRYRSSYRFWYWYMMARDLQGVASSIVEDDAGGMPVALHEVYSEFGRIQHQSAPDGGTAGYVYRRQDGQNIPLGLRDVIQSQNVHPETPYEGISLIEVLAYQLDKELFTDMFERRTLKEGRPPELQIVFDKEISTDQAERYGKLFKDKFYDRPGGSVKGVPVFGSGGRAESISINPKDFQLLESRGLTRSDIHNVTGCFEAIFRHGSNRAESEQAYTSFMRLTIQPLATQLAADFTLQFQRSFAADRGKLVIAAPDVVPSSRKEREEINAMRLRRGVPAATIMEEEGEEAPAGADQPMIDASLVPLGTPFQ